MVEMCPSAVHVALCLAEVLWWSNYCGMEGAACADNACTSMLVCTSALIHGLLLLPLLLLLLGWLQQL